MPTDRHTIYPGSGLGLYIRHTIYPGSGLGLVENGIVEVEVVALAGAGLDTELI